MVVPHIKVFLLCPDTSFDPPYASVAQLLRPRDLWEGIQVRVETCLQILKSWTSEKLLLISPSPALKMTKNYV